MSITATCGHTLTDSEGLGTSIAIKDRCKDGSKAIGYLTLCDKCLEWYRKSKLELKTEKECERWLNAI